MVSLNFCFSLSLLDTELLDNGFLDGLYRRSQDVEVLLPLEHALCTEIALTKTQRAFNKRGEFFDPES